MFFPPDPSSRDVSRGLLFDTATPGPRLPPNGPGTYRDPWRRNRLGSTLGGTFFFVLFVNLDRKTCQTQIRLVVVLLASL